MNDKSGNKEMYEVALGALLHDVGKFLQRAEVELDEQSLGMTGFLCRTDPKSGQPSHQHVLYTNFFMERVLNVWPDGLDKSKVANLASYHHKPDHPLRLIIQQADWASSGSDRTKREDERTVRFKQQALKSIFSSVRLLEERPPRYYRLEALDESQKGIFPQPEESLERGAYQTLFQAFRRDVARLPDTGCKLYLESLAALLRKYTWCIPSDTVREPDIPLYDHLFTTAAIACALYAFHSEAGQLDDERAIRDQETPKLLFLVGDLSGIQKFLFDLRQTGARGVSKVLRGRSFLLTLLSLAASEVILDTLGLPPVCKVIDAGGRFKILLPCTERTLAAVEQLRDRFDRYCLETFKGELSVNLALSRPLALRDFSQENYRSILDDTFSRVEREKNRPLSMALGEAQAWQWEPLYEQLARYGECPHCGKEPAGSASQGEDRRKPGPLCHWALSLGRDLPRARFLTLRKVPAGSEQALFGTLRPELSERLDGGEVLFLTTFEENPQGAFYPRMDISRYLPVYSRQEEQEWRKSHPEEAEEEEEIRQGMPKTFQHIAEASTGIALLGVYKADLDRLGLIFSEGLQTKISLSREATLSRMLNFFFTRYLSHFLRERYGDTYTLFSGGDDLCLFGPWDRIIEAARQLNAELARFTGSPDNDRTDGKDLTLSAGIELVHPRFPAGRAVERASVRLEASKDAGRNRLTLFGHTLPWGREVERYLEFSDRLTEHLRDDDSPISRGFLYRLLGYYKEYLRYRQVEDDQRDLRGLLYLPHLKYDIARNIAGSEKKRKEEAEQLLRPLLESRGEPDGKLFIDHLPVAVFITLYKARGKSAEKGEKE